MSFVHFLAFSHLKKRRAISLLFFFFILLGLRKGFYKEGIEICLFPISLSNEFSGNVSSRSLCFNFIVHILVCTFYDCQIGFNKNFSLQRKLCRLGTLKRSAKRVILRTKRNPFLEAKVLSPAWNLFFPQHSRRCWRPRTERITWNSRKQRWEVLLFEAFICMAWRE